MDGMSYAPDPYEVLGVSRDAGVAQIKAAFRNAALKCHPDSQAGDADKAERKFRELIAAYRFVLRRAGQGARPPRPADSRRTYTPQDLAAPTPSRAPPSTPPATRRRPSSRCG